MCETFLDEPYHHNSSIWIAQAQFPKIYRQMDGIRWFHLITMHTSIWHYNKKTGVKICVGGNMKGKNL